eukprot:m.355596 g.355596  ORF g.355596 m.355596 type:complete len:192 (-) comp17290_c0_seq1:289-864(-)
MPALPEEFVRMLARTSNSQQQLLVNASQAARNSREVEHEVVLKSGSEIDLFVRAGNAARFKRPVQAPEEDEYDMHNTSIDSLDLSQLSDFTPVETPMCVDSRHSLQSDDEFVLQSQSSFASMNSSFSSDSSPSPSTTPLSPSSPSSTSLCASPFTSRIASTGTSRRVLTRTRQTARRQSRICGINHGVSLV